MPDGPQHLPPPSTVKRELRNPLGLAFQLFCLIMNLFVSLFVSVYRIFSPLPKQNISGKVVLVTGSGRGLGQGLALEFARQGCKVACAEIQSDLNAETVKMINEISPGSAKGYFCDVGKPDSVENLKKQILADFGRVDILVNNAGLVAGGPMMSPDFKNEIIETIAKVNFLSHVWMCRTFLPEMIERNSGHIVCISSMSALTGLPNATLYAACKWGITGLMESIRDELRLNPNNQIQTSVVLPYFINTSAQYTKSWDTRMPEMSVEHCAKEVIRGVRENQIIFSIPREQYYAGVFVKLLPQNIRDQFYAIFSAKVKDIKAKDINHFNAFKIASGVYGKKE